MMAFSGRPQLVGHVGEELRLHPARVFELDVLLLQRLLEALALGHVARRGEHALQPAVAVVEGGRVVGHHRLLAVPGARGELVVGDLAFGQHALDARLGPLRIGEVVLERRADQLVARAAGQRLHLLVDVGDDAARIGGHQRVDVGFDQRARVELLVAQPLIELRPLLFDLLARGVVGADQQIADDGVLRVAQRRDRHHRREAAAVLADVGQLVDVLDPARGLEHQGLEARRDRGAELDAQRLGARDHFLRIGNVGRRDLVHHLGGRVAQHPLGADVEDLDDALRVGGDAREVGAVEDRALQGPRLEQRLFRLLAGGVVGADQQVADDGVLRVAQRRDRHDRREPAAVLADVGQLVDVLDPARGLEHQRLEARRDRGAELDAQRLGARDHFLRIGNVGRRDLVHHLGGRVAQHALGADVEDLDDALRVGGDAREVGAVEDRALQGSRREQGVGVPNVQLHINRLDDLLAREHRSSPQVSARPASGRMGCGLGSKFGSTSQSGRRRLTTMTKGRSRPLFRGPCDTPARTLRSWHFAKIRRRIANLPRTSRPSRTDPSVKRTVSASSAGRPRCPWIA